MSHPNNDEHLPDEYPFKGLQISNNDILNSLESRYSCEKCHKSRKFFCYTCFIPHPQLQGVIPHVNLPVQIDIIKHKREIDGKSTAAHAALLAPDKVTVYTYPDIPSYEDEDAVLIYPSSAALDIPQLFDKSTQLKQMKSKFNQIQYPKGYHIGTLLKSRNVSEVSEAENTQPEFQGFIPIKRAVFIDSTWNQSKHIYKDERVKKLPCVALHKRISQFWRHQKDSPRWYLATIEAVHQFVLELHLNAFGVSNNYDGLKCCFDAENLTKYGLYLSDDHLAYSGQYDDLLYFFEYMYKLIHTYYNHEQLYAYTRRMS